ncbi:flagellar basal body P-ring formation chaperone FlgA [Paraburkholderia antibiotica]|uniref:Flagellar basal body P-ring formation protein FlgA n=1 Tax=Paraburkholderia antibiotica TaxID=2728839 RepID=A0A7X9X5Z9_9BURK|nr:flagellar basal body P-ring formation chaperone FlgA [Paraburkholderia antibiotica]NML32066.1 flagellar basal body P-ring formation protein FlgA [Paraburkholderia antibiotica]
MSSQSTSALPQRAQRTTVRRVGGGRFARRALRGFMRGCARCLTRLIVNVAVWVAGGIVLLPTTSQAQDAGGPIVIAGPGEKNPAALNDLVQKIQTPAQRSASAASLAAATAQSLGRAPAQRENDPFARAANATDAIVIPGSGETAPAAPTMIRTNFKPDANGVVTIPPPANAGAAGVARVNVETGARAVVPVIVTPSSGRASDADARAVAANAPQGAGFDSLASRGEPPELGANGKPIATAGAQPRAVTSTVTSARIPPAMLRAAAPGVAPKNPPTGAAVATAAAATVGATPAPLPGQQDPEAIHAAALAFLQQQAIGLPGKVDITVAPAFPRGLAACSALAPFMPTGARLWGRSTVGVRCAGEHPWTIYLQARIALHATYYLAARAMAPGEVLTAADLVARDGDLSGLPQAIVTDPSQAVGSVSLVRIAGGMPLRRDMLRSASAVAIGQTVRVVAAGDGFSISSEGSAMNNASPGQQVRVKTANGQIISGIVKDGGTVEIQM